MEISSNDEGKNIANYVHRFQFAQAVTKQKQKKIIFLIVSVLYVSSNILLDPSKLLYYSCLFNFCLFTFMLLIKGTITI